MLRLLFCGDNMRGISRHDEVLKYLNDFNLYHMRMPTRKEIMFDCKMGRGPLQRLIGRLEEKGKLKRLPKGILEFRVIK